MTLCIPLDRPRPDAAGFIDTLMGRQHASTPPMIEYLIDTAVMRPIVRDLMEREWVEEGGDRASQEACLDTFIAFWYRMGYDFVRFERGMEFSERKLLAPDTAAGVSQNRAWADEHTGSIQSWEDFEAYPWPRLENVDFFPFEYISENLPEGMGLITCHAAGVFEHLSWIMSLEGLCLAVHDTPKLVQAIADRLGELMLGFYRHLVDLDNVIAIFPGDDMGFRTGTLVSPDDLRRYVLPWHKRFAELAHEHNLPYFLHSCGNVERIMKDLIEDVGIDGKHSYEDAIMPAEAFQTRYGNCVAVLGGIDLNILAGGSPEDVRARTRELMMTCGRRGRYAVGSGNSVPSYVPMANYLAMVDEALSFSG